MHYGDSGGPFVCNEDGRYVLRGAVSWGNSKCRTDHYTVFARISSFVGWINQKKSGNLKISVNLFSFNITLRVLEITTYKKNRTSTDLP